MSRAKTLIAAMIGVLALSGFTAALASAEPTGWMVNGTVLGQTAALSTTARVDQTVVLKSSLGLEISCEGETLDLVNPRINGLNKMSEADSLRFLECKGTQTCQLPISQKGTISTLPVLVDFTLDGTTAVKGKLLAANTSKLFATIAFEGAECNFAGVLALRGTQAFLAPTGRQERSAQQLNLVTETSGELTFAGTAATLSGSILLQPQSGLPFSFL